MILIFITVISIIISTIAIPSFIVSVATLSSGSLSFSVYVLPSRYYIRCPADVVWLAATYLLVTGSFIGAFILLVTIFWVIGQVIMLAVYS